MVKDAVSAADCRTWRINGSNGSASTSPLDLRLPTAFALLFVLGLATSLSGKEPADYRIGDTVQEDIVAPSQFIVVDPERTAALKYREGQKLPVLFRFQPEMADAVEGEFRGAFAAARSNFLGVVQSVIGRPRLGTNMVTHEELQRLLTAYQQQHRSFPLEAELAARWALGDAGGTIQASWLARLRAAMEQPIRNGTEPEEFESDSLVRLVRVTDRNEPLTLDFVAQRGVSMTRSNLLLLAVARAEFRQTAPPEERNFADYVATFLKPNCFLEAELTRQSRAKATEQLYVADTYERGQVIARRGEVVDKKIMAALDRLREQAQMGELQQQVTQQQSATQLVSERNRWLIIGLAGVTGLLVLVIWRLGRPRRPAVAALARAEIADAAVANRLTGGARGALTENTSAEGWQQRALEAEQRAQRATDAVRDGLLPHLAEVLKTRLVQGLVSQRADLLEAQQRAAAEVAELERRLDQVHAPLQERMKAYEQRIADLERQLAQKGGDQRESLPTEANAASNLAAAERPARRMVINPGKPDAWEIRLKPGTNSFGRGPGNDFRLDDPSVSIAHCQIVVSGDSVMLKDLGSTNGTYVNRTRVVIAPLQPGYQIHLGTVEMLFDAEPPPPERLRLARSQPRMAEPLDPAGRN